MIHINSTENKSIDIKIENNNEKNENKIKNIKIKKSEKYLGKRGYIIDKSFFEENKLQEIRDELNVRPFSNMDYGIPEESFKVYKENLTHMYLPKYYGNNKLGKCTINKVPEGETIDLKFSLQLKEEQKLPAEKTIESYHNDGGGILTLPCGFGKCMGIDTPVLMFDGTIKMVQDVKIGDKLMGDDSTPRNVLSLARGREQMYKVVPNKGDSYVVNESHILSLKYSSNVNKNTPKGTVRDISVLDYLNLPKSYHGRGGVLVGYRVPIIFPKVLVKIDPYLLGYWLGDGSSRGALITTQEASVLKYLSSDCFKNKHPTLYLQYTGAQYDYRINSTNISKAGSNELLNYLRDYNLILNKHIPLDYKCNERQVQLELLAGIIDSDGYYNENCYDVIQKNEKLLDDIIFIARSLGFAAYKNKCKKSCMYKGEKREGTYFRTTIHGKGLEEIPVKCPRKKAEPRKQIKDALNTRIKIEKLKVDDYYGFMIDGNHRYLLGDFTVTHNTIMALYFISVLKKKTLVIVHKEFLMNQWIERIEFALPDARIGIIQGKKCEIENKDIIIGMLQTLSMREFERDAFDTIGHVIIDECHRIPSRIFSKALFRIHSTYMLGLSATPNRKDGLTKILKWFAGEIIYSVKMNEKNIVKVERYLLQSDNEIYNREVLSYKGQVQMATMVNNISNYLKRTKLIIDLVVKELHVHESRQILILSDRKQQLKDMEKLLEEAKIDNVGYYVGGMKKEKLKENESCRVLLGTFPMANEGLDIPSLNGLVLATPKSDIIQTVGRISRIKHENIQALIIDIVDCFSLFEKQSKKRVDVYKKKAYEVEDIKYNIETNNELGRKKYFYHNILKKNEEDNQENIFLSTGISTKKNSKKNIKNEIDFENMDSKTYKINTPKENNIISFFN
jgi:superfamily II DNA or RNA helicase